jgi:hypothetical protein
VREVLRALAEAHGQSFYPLWVELTRRIKKPIPHIGFRIFQVADSRDAHVVVWASAIRSDGNEVSWAVAVDTRDDELVVSGEVDIQDDFGNRTLFSLEERTTDPARAGELVRTFAREVCARRECLEAPGA